jgi:HlyD family secretion protein
MLKKIVIAVVVLAVAGGAAYGAWWWLHHDHKPADRLTLYGNVDIRQVQLAFNASGRVERMPFQEGDRVEAGNLVAELDAERYRARLAQAEARVAAQEQVVARLEAGSRPEEIARAGANLARAQAQLQDKAKLYRRQKALAEANSLAQQQLDDTEAAYQAAKAEVEAMRQALRLAEKGPRVQDVAAARAELRAARAELRLAEKELADTRLHAPADGVVQARVLEPGDMASPSRPVYTLALTNPVWVRAFVEEPDLGKVTPGMSAWVRTDSFPDKRYQGWIGYVSPTAEFTPKRVQTAELRTKLVYRIKVVVCNPAGQLRLGMPVTVVLPLDQPQAPEGRHPSRPCPDQADGR